MGGQRKAGGPAAGTRAGQPETPDVRGLKPEMANYEFTGVDFRPRGCAVIHHSRDPKMTETRNRCVRTVFRIVHSPRVLTRTPAAPCAAHRAESQAGVA